MSTWVPPAGLWKDRTVAILAGGPSLTQAAADEVRARGWACIAVNNSSFRFAPWADIALAADVAWWITYRKEVEVVQGIRLHCTRYSCHVEGLQVWIPRVVGGHSALHATHVAEDLGAKRAVLLGVDLDVKQVTHHHGAHPDSLRPPTAADFRAAVKAWGRYASRRRSMEVINCNPKSALTVFPRMPLEAVPA